MVRTSQDVNIANSKRAEIANDAEADLFIRLHCDGNDKRSMMGLSTLVPASNKWTRPIVGEQHARREATCTRRSSRQTGANDLGVGDRGDLSGFNWSKVPTVLVEMGFMTNPGEDVKLGAAGVPAAARRRPCQRDRGLPHVRVAERTAREHASGPPEGSPFCETS